MFSKPVFVSEREARVFFLNFSPKPTRQQKTESDRGGRGQMLMNSVRKFLFGSRRAMFGNFGFIVYLAPGLAALRRSQFFYYLLKSFVRLGLVSVPLWVRLGEAWVPFGKSFL